MKAELQRRRQAEGELTARVSFLQQAVLDLEERLQQAASSPGSGSGAEATAKELRDEEEQLGRARSERLRMASSAALAEFDVHLTKQLEALISFAVAEACGREDKIFTSGFARKSRLLLCTNMNLTE